MLDYIIGIDEVGRGALAGPVAVAAVYLPKKIRFRNLKDSKKLSPKKREVWFKKVKADKRIFFAVVMVSPRIIDEINISEAANRAATRALNKLIADFRLPISKTAIYLDAGLKITKKLTPNPYKLKAIIKGDEKINAVKLASIVAKVTRDRLMIRSHKKYPAYDFHKHKGYGTKAHFSALKINNICEIHRLTFLKSVKTLQNKGFLSSS